MNINIEKNPFSSRGAYLAIQKSPTIFGDGIWLRTLIRPEWGTIRKKISDKVLRFIPTDSNGVFISYKTICTPNCLRFESNFGYIEIFFSSIKSIDITTNNMGLVLEHDNDESKLVNVEVNKKSAKGYFPITFFDLDINVYKGSMEYDNKSNRFYITSEDQAHLQISAWHRNIDLPNNLHSVPNKDIILEDYKMFRAYYDPQCETEELACYILWSGEYEKCGNLTRNVTAISKSLMNNIWSWDNCFIALSLAKANKELARDNIMLFFDLQLEDGRLLDAVNPYIKVDWFTKPPIHGYFIMKMLQDKEIFDINTLKDLYPKLIKWAKWWDRFKGSNGLYAYKDPFDSGWDNSTCFDKGMPVYSPDLNSYMVLMYKCIGQIADKLQLKEASIYYKTSEDILNQMLKVMFDGQQFVCLGADEKPFETTSLIKMMPIMLGELLPSEVFECLAQEISKENHFLTENSLATESVMSKLYDQRKGVSSKPNAYWRGPVWAPPVYCIYDGLLNAGYNKLAIKIANRFIALIESDPKGIYENYDAILKTGYDDVSYMWTVAVYMIFKAHKKI